MFIKRDLRKIEQVLADTTNEKKILKFSNRKEEFQSNIKILCRESYIKSSFSNLLTLNLYANDISNIEGVGLFSHTPIEEINLGNNKISKIPLEVFLKIIGISIGILSVNTIFLQIFIVRNLVYFAKSLS